VPSYAAAGPALERSRGSSTTHSSTAAAGALRAPRLPPAPGFGQSRLGAGIGLLVAWAWPLERVAEAA